MPSDIQELIHRQANFIRSHQLPSGAIPWYEGGITDPWDHVECAIALDLSGRLDEASRAYRWLREVQNPDGSWWSSYLAGQPQDLTRDANYSSYIAVGLWYHYLATRDADFLAQMWPTVEKAMSFALGLQQPTGEVYWAYDSGTIVWPAGLLAGSSCIWQSLRSGLRIAKVLGLDRPDWDRASERLAEAIRERPELFDRFGENRRDYAVNWFYPVLAGVIRGEGARKRLLERWEDFVVDNWGCKCTAEYPWWVTVAETCELIMALASVGEHNRGRPLLDWILRLQDSDGGFWTGIKIPEETIWPEEKPTWVAAAVIMALQVQAKAVGKDAGR
ncbi:prenyltransferase [Dehalococcoidia bacterium]|nr:prenyltransferase [Dehalococcoidia bacterium]